MNEAILNEDLTLKQDQARLIACQEFFSNLPHEAVDEDNIDNCLIRIISYLRDTWSVIRSECAKLIAKYSTTTNDSVPQEMWTSLAKTLQDSFQSITQWQIIHGTLLGLNALVPVLDSSYLEVVSNLCLDVIGHARIPIKEASRSCLLSIQKKLLNKNKMVNKIIMLVDVTVRSPTSDTEMSTLGLDGMLGCLVDNYQQFPQLILSAGLMLPSFDADADHNSSVEVVNTIKLCALHPASTVRQKAGQILTLFVLTFLKQYEQQGAAADVSLSQQQQASSSLGGGVPLIVTIITTLMSESLKSRSSDLWRMQEISLMVTEDIVRTLIEAELSQVSRLQPKANDANYNTTSNSRSMVNSNEMDSQRRNSDLVLHMYRFLEFLKNHMSVLLSHDQFEVRRMAIQLLPQLARAFVLMNSSLRRNHASLSMEISKLGSSGGLPAIGKNSLPPPTQPQQQPSSSSSSSSSGTVASRASGTSTTTTAAEAFVSQQEATYSADTARGGEDLLLQTGEVNLNSSLRSTSNLIPVTLDLNMSTKVIWLNEIIKENQHLFEAFEVSDSWASSKITRDIRLRSHTVGASGFESSTSSKYPSPVKQTVAISATSTGYGGVGGRNGPPLSGRGILYPETATSNGVVQVEGETTTVSRGVVDCWSLDVRGRIQEIEHRCRFHRFIKHTVCNSSDDDEVDKIVELLSSNVISILNIVEEVLDVWEDIFPSVDDYRNRNKTHSRRWNDDSDDADDDLDGLLSTLPLAKDPVALTTDFIECYALVHSFLLSVQYRYKECYLLRPLHHDMLTNRVGDAGEDEDTSKVKTMIRRAKTHMQRLEKLHCDWILQAAKQQHASRSSTKLSSRTTHISGFSAQQRQSATGFLLIHSNLQEQARNHTPSSLASSPSSTFQKQTGTHVAHMNILQNFVLHASNGMGIADQKETISNTYNIEHVLLNDSQYHRSTGTGTPAAGGAAAGGATNTTRKSIPCSEDIDRIVLIATLTNPAIHPSSYLGSSQSMGVDGTVLQQQQQESPNSTSSSTYHTRYSITHQQHRQQPPASPTASQAKSASSVASPTYSLSVGGEGRGAAATGEGADPLAHVGIGPGISISKGPIGTKSINTSTFTVHTSGGGGDSNNSAMQYKSSMKEQQAMDRWNCEAVSPLLSCMANAVTHPTTALHLTALVVEWTVACLVNPLWLDNRHNPKKNMFEAMALLLHTANENIVVASAPILPSHSPHSNTNVTPNADPSLRAAAPTTTPTATADPMMFFLLLRIVRAMAEIFALRSNKPILELKYLMCLVKAARLAVAVSLKCYSILLESSSLNGLASLPATITTATTGKSTQNPVEAVDNTQLNPAGAATLLPVVAKMEISVFVGASVDCIMQSLEYYKSVFPTLSTPATAAAGLPPTVAGADAPIPPTPPPVSSPEEQYASIFPSAVLRAEALQQRYNNDHDSNNNNNDITTATAAAGSRASSTIGDGDILSIPGGVGGPCGATGTAAGGGASGADADMDEFSDWDEESDSDDDLATTTDASQVHMNNLTNLLWEDMRNLTLELRHWAASLQLQG